MISKERNKGQETELMHKQDFIAVLFSRSQLLAFKFVEETIIFSSSVDYLPNDGRVDKSFPGQKEPKTI